jgi:hypothetical protein
VPGSAHPALATPIILPSAVAVQAVLSPAVGTTSTFPIPSSSDAVLRSLVSTVSPTGIASPSMGLITSPQFAAPPTHSVAPPAQIVSTVAGTSAEQHDLAGSSPDHSCLEESVDAGDLLLPSGPPLLTAHSSTDSVSAMLQVVRGMEDAKQVDSSTVTLRGCIHILNFDCSRGYVVVQEDHGSTFYSFRIADVELELAEWLLSGARHPKDFKALVDIVVSAGSDTAMHVFPVRAWGRVYRTGAAFGFVRLTAPPELMNAEVYFHNTAVALADAPLVVGEEVELALKQAPPHFGGLASIWVVSASATPADDPSHV